MGPIQSGINQSLAILSLASSQSPQAQANRKATASTSKLEKVAKQMPSSELTKEQLDTFNEFKETAVKSNIEAGRVDTAADIKSNKFFDKQKGEKGVTFGKVATGRPIEGYSEEAYTKGVEEKPAFELNKKTDASKDFDEFKKAHQVSMEELDKRLSAKKRIKVNMDMMKNALKEDN